jgi:prevent-host-death family protein
MIVMNMVNIHEAKARLSEYVDAVERGERVIICRRNQPVAELKAVAPVRTMARLVGGAAGALVVPDSFFAPLPDDLVDGFYDGSVARPAGAARVAERSAGYRARGSPKRRPQR